MSFVRGVRAARGGRVPPLPPGLPRRLAGFGRPGARPRVFAMAPHRVGIGRHGRRRRCRDDLDGLLWAAALQRQGRQRSRRLQRLPRQRENERARGLQRQRSIDSSHRARSEWRRHRSELRWRRWDANVSDDRGKHTGERFDLLGRPGTECLVGVLCARSSELSERVRISGRLEPSERTLAALRAALSLFALATSP